MDEPVLNTREASALLGLAVPTLNKLRVYGDGPIFLKLGRAVRYRRADLESWLASRVRRSTSDKAGSQA
jgi:predicted DNA-binding transcriptional regulator AlpA